MSQTLTILADIRDAHWLARTMSQDLGIQAWVETERLDRHAIVTDPAHDGPLLRAYCRGFHAAAGIDQVSDVPH